MGVVVLGPQEMGVVVGHERQAQLLGQPDELGVDPLLLGDAGPLELDIEPRLPAAVGGEVPGVPARLVEGGLVVGVVLCLDVLCQVMGQRAAEVTVDGDETLRPPGEGRAVHARPVVEAVLEGVGAQLEQVPPAGVVLGEQDEVKPAVGEPRRRALEPVARRDVGLDAQDRLDPGRLRLRVELDRAVKVAVIGHRDGGHAQLPHALHQPIDLDAAVEERVLGVQVQVNEAEAGRSAVQSPDMLCFPRFFRHAQYHMLGVGLSPDAGIVPRRPGPGHHSAGRPQPCNPSRALPKQRVARRTPAGSRRSPRNASSW